MLRACFARVGWTAANVAFMRSGGYRLSARVRDVAQRTLLLWGRHDEIVDPMFAQRYLQDLPDCRCARAVQHRACRSPKRNMWTVASTASMCLLAAPRPAGMRLLSHIVTGLGVFRREGCRSFAWFVALPQPYRNGYFLSVGSFMALQAGVAREVWALRPFGRAGPHGALSAGLCGYSGEVGRIAFCEHAGPQCHGTIYQRMHVMRTAENK